MRERESAHEVMRRGVRKLRAAGIENPALDAKILLQHAAGWDASEYVANASHTINSIVRDQFERLIERRVTHEPVSHIVGLRDFWLDRFIVTPDVLDPRPDSETLIEAMLELRPDRDRPYRIVDFGTGSGCLLLTLLREYPQATGVGIDLSEAALGIASKNANALNLNDRVRFLHANWGETLTECYDMVISNPPYIEEQAIASLAPEVREYEPITALSGGADGLAAYRTLMPHIKRCLANDGIAVLELGADQAGDVSAVAERHGLAVVKLQADLAGIERALCINHQA